MRGTERAAVSEAGQRDAGASASAPDKTFDRDADSGSRNEGELRREAVAATLQHHLSKVQACYERELIDNPDLSGRLDFAWVIQTSGEVFDLRLIKDQLGNTNVAECVRTVIADITFPEPKGGPVTIKYPFVFRDTPPDSGRAPKSGESDK